MTLLESYIKFRGHDYIEPERKGVPKGHDIGFSRGRVLASLYSIYDYELKEIANLSGITYAFLRKLRSEKSFQESVKDDRSDFIDDVFMYFMSGQTTVLNPDLPANLCDQVEGGMEAIDLSPESAFADAAHYSAEFKKEFTDVIIRVIQRDDIQDIELNMDRLFCLMSTWNETELNKAIFKPLVEYGEQLICSTIGNVDATEEMRNRAINFTHLISKLSTTL